ncbi:hypothetical protein [Antarctobacter sp.]|uniref:hypothetical protein n=1 Tax=Antarctobacter sp. TaxID=1872577 RepID=UPI002B26B81F|nr:hypothetical protein [Antarctobacter sp.]
MADTLKIDLKWCYGINKLEDELRFTHKGLAIYAPNGVMKTSFAKTLKDLSAGKVPSDLAFPERNSKCEVTLNGNALERNEIFVVNSYDENYSSGEISTLLANADLKRQYEEVHKKIGAAKSALDKRLKEFSGFGERSRTAMDPIIEEIFGLPYYDALLALEDEISGAIDTDFDEANYKVLFDPKVRELLQANDAAEIVEEFARKYDELTQNSPVLRQDFQYHHAHQVQQQLKLNNFFEAGHSINLLDKSSAVKSEFTSSQELEERIEAEKAAVLNDAELKAKFEEFNAKLKNKELQAFRDYITQNQHLLPEMQNLGEFERKLWVQYMFKAHEEYEALLTEYKSGQDALRTIVAAASANPNDWDVVISDFNRRFLHLPFELRVENKADVILKDTAPSIEFSFRDGEQEAVYKDSQRKELLRILSTGEARALYILNIMFEVYMRKKLRRKTLFIFDDISDSFDYKNKFAIIDYLEDVTKVEDVDFLAIVLTHNFDFLRTVESRGICASHQCFMASKTPDGVTLSKFKRSDIRNPFEKWKERLAESVIQVAFIPFLRNVIEYSQGAKDAAGTDNPDYLTLTRMVHFKNESAALTMGDYKQIFERAFPNETFPAVDEHISVLDFILIVADDCLNQPDGINLEHKIVLSIATRIRSERYMVRKIREVEDSYDSSRKQMGNLLGDFKTTYNNLTDEIRLLQRANLITPSNIHINAFMYEPILDMGFGELKELYERVKVELQ